MSTSNKLPGVDQRLKNVANALYLTTANNVAIRTGIEGDVIINGPVSVPGTVTVDSTPEDPVHVHVTELSSGTVSLSSSTLAALENISVQNNVTATITSMPAITGSITVTNFTSTVQVSNIVTATITSMPPFTGTATVYQGTTPWLIKNTNTATDVVIADSNYEMNVARGLVDSQYVEMKNGYAPSMNTGEATVWGLNTAYPWSAWTGTGSRLWVGSDNAADVGQTFYIDGLDSNFARINETVTLNGTTYVQTTKTFYRVNRMYQLTGAANTGNISARVTSSSGTQVYYILAGNARGKNGIFTIPAGYTAYILYGDASSYKNGSGNVSGQVDMYTRTNSTGTMPFMNQFAAVVANGQYRNEFNVPLQIPQKTDIDVRFNPSGNATTVSVNWEMIMVPN